MKTLFFNIKFPGLTFSKSSLAEIPQIGSNRHSPDDIRLRGRDRQGRKIGNCTSTVDATGARHPLKVKTTRKEGRRSTAKKTPPLKSPLTTTSATCS